MQKLVGQIGVLFSGESKSAIKNGDSYLSFLSSPHPHPQGVAVGGRVWYHWMSPFEANNFHYPLFFYLMHSSRDISMSSDKMATLYMVWYMVCVYGIGICIWYMVWYGNVVWYPGNMKVP